MKTVETKREDVQRKQTLREVRIAKTGKGGPAAEVPLTNGTNGTNEEHKEDAESPTDELPDTTETTVHDTPKEISDEGSTVEEKLDAIITAEPEPKPADTAKPKEWKHFNISCNLCNVSPIVGARFNCTKYASLHCQFALLRLEYSKACPHFNLCQACFDKREHDQTHQMTVFCAPEEAVHQEECSTCKVKPIVGTLYGCLECVPFPTAFAHILVY